MPVYRTMIVIEIFIIFIIRAIHGAFKLLKDKTNQTFVLFNSVLSVLQNYL